MSDYLARELTAPVAATADHPGGLVHALVYVPRAVVAGGGRAPLVVCCHGLGESGLRVAPVAQRLAAAGAVAIAPSFRGGGAPTAGPTTEMTIRTEAADLQAVLAVARTWPFVDAARTALFGRSQGGLVAMLEAAAHPAQIAALALWYPALAAPASVRRRFGRIDAVPASFAYRVDEHDLTLGRAFARDLWDLEVEDRMRGYRAPVLIVHGEQDADVPIAVSEAAVRTLPDARLVRVPGAAHGFGDANFETAVTRTIAFLTWAGVLDD
ncbi:alpha/beta hydrolase family protein [Actinomyces sp. MRS3W]|uniref:alpha/beta hydrolase family protein n=1 Tax=Actinomyces sp. MRS3W TaxID=2800796 RepID=UPI0028FD80ED|nr:alpha/beta fold hydrolase [Actinomyces sp. MRS3W]MDU0347998.1 alpha/beta hydrolase [Actinomyces sp. MRS3W]